MADQRALISGYLRDRCLEVLARTPKWLAAMHHCLSQPSWLEEVEWIGPSALAHDAQALVDRFASLAPGRDRSHHIATVAHSLRQIDQTDLKGRDAELLEQAAGQFYLLGLFESLCWAELPERPSVRSACLAFPVDGLCAAAALTEMLFGVALTFERDARGRVRPKHYLDFSDLPVVPGAGGAEEVAPALYAEMNARLFTSIGGDGQYWNSESPGAQLDVLRDRIRSERQSGRRWRIAFESGRGGVLDTQEEAKRLAETFEIPVIAWGSSAARSLEEVLGVRAEVFHQRIDEFHKQVVRVLYPDIARSREAEALWQQVLRLQLQLTQTEHAVRTAELAGLAEKLSRNIAAKHSASSESWLRTNWAGLKEALEPLAAVKDSIDLGSTAYKTLQDMTEFFSTFS